MPICWVCFGIWWWNLVILFGTMEDLNWANCTLPWTWWNYMQWSHHSLDNGSVRGTCCCIPLQCGIQSQTAGDGRATHSSPTNSSKWGRHHMPSPCWAWRPKWHSELWQLINDLTQEIAQCKLTAPHSNPPPNDWVHVLWAVESPRKMTRRSPFQEGEGGVQRGKPPQFLESPAGGRVPSGPPQQLPCPALAGPDMGWLITALTSRSVYQDPKNKHLQWQCGILVKLRCLMITVEPQSAVY